MIGLTTRTARGVRVLLLLCALGASARAVAAQVATAPGATAPVTTAGIVRAANAFLATLDTAQRRRVLYAFDDDVQRRRWSNFPTGFVPRGGISLRQMNATQRAAALALVSTALSRRGYEKVQQIMEADEVFKATDRGPPGGGRPGGGPPRGGPPGTPPGGPPGGGPPPGGPPGGGRPGRGAAMFGRDLYFIAILGTPSERTPWMLQYGGHHLALNLTVAGDRGVLTPSLTGAQPARYTVNGRTVRPIGEESDQALALLNTLDASQRAQAVLNYRVPDLVLGPGQDGKTIQPEGLPASAMTARQRALLLDLIGVWAGIVHEREAATRMAELRADLDGTYFAWSGPTTGEAGQNISAYYRIQGPHLVIEYAPQRDEPTNHVHTIYRDPTNDYGRVLTAK
ncbi:hypothetical protein tb265_41220 [Gemmatimonadetes bacterium T265]|nr:hypothetical protein tb265_41220 [Gemmatimonadetes bacterium T265]